MADNLRHEVESEGDEVADLHVVATSVADPAFMERIKPDVLLLDAGLGDDDSLHVASALHKRFAATKIIVMDLIPMSDDIMQFVNAGVCGLVRWRCT